MHIRGVDDLTTKDIKDFSTEHYPSHDPTRVEWIDDTSANIVYDDAATAGEALESFILPSDGSENSSFSALHLRRAKMLPNHPELDLQVRTALVTDQKRPRAYETSRFYLMHPEHDPREQRRREERRSNGDYQRRGYSHEEHRRRRRRDHEEGFDASMYDDKPASGGRDSTDLFFEEHHNESHRPSQPHRDSYRPARDRSASPNRQGTRDNGRKRQRTPPPSYRSRDPNPFPSENQGKELFPSKSSPGGEADKNGQELFSNKMLAVGLKKELFPTKVNNTNHHRRTDAFDAADETADLFANGLSVPFTEGAQASRSLADRITNAKTATSYGRLNASDPEPRAPTQTQNNDDLNIRGASSQRDNGFSIRGGASAAGTIKELFPGKAIGNEGKELFAGKLRGGRRNRAEDMFH